MHPAAQRVQDALAAAGSRATVQELPDSTRTAVEAARALGVEVAQIAKSLVFRADGDPIVVIASGADRIDTAALARLLGASRVERADAVAVRETTGYAIGGVSPAGLPPSVRVVVDDALSEHEPIWAAAGTPHAVYPTTYAELLGVAGATPASVREHRNDAGRGKSGSASR